jgi:hypothetical protein
MHTTHKDRSANVRKGDWYLTVDGISGNYSVQTTIDKREHAFRRPELAPAFSEPALREQEKFIDQSVGIFLEQMTKQTAKDGWSEPKDFWRIDHLLWIRFHQRPVLWVQKSKCWKRKSRYLPDLIKGTSAFLYYASVCDLTRKVVS